ncbi:MAG: hypothetical protein M3Y87_35595 [Myxococcota bacterium]|nr:hypothetical protein [Myxococcota bacterium]
MEAREVYKQKYEAQMHEWSAKLDVMKAKSEKLTAQAKLDMLPHLDAASGKLDSAKARLAEITSATEDKWSEVVDRVELGWKDLQASVEGAYAAMKPHDDKE